MGIRLRGEISAPRIRGEIIGGMRLRGEIIYSSGAVEPPTPVESVDAAAARIWAALAVGNNYALDVVTSDHARVKWQYDTVGRGSTNDQFPAANLADPAGFRLWRWRSRVNPLALDFFRGGDGTFDYTTSIYNSLAYDMYIISLETREWLSFDMTDTDTLVSNSFRYTNTTVATSRRGNAPGTITDWVNGIDNQRVIIAISNALDYDPYP